MWVWFLPLSLLVGCFGAPQREVIVTIQTKKWTHLLNEKFLSFTIPPDIVLQFEDFSPTTLNMLKGLSPAMMRLGGPNTDKMKFMPSKNTTDNYTISEIQWKRMNQFAQDANLDLIICLNAKDRVHGLWESRDALELVYSSDKNGYDLGWQLGYESQHLMKDGVTTGTQLGRDNVRLRKVLDAFPRYSRSAIIGPDVMTLSTPEEIRFVKDYLNESGDSLTAITWHPQFSLTNPEDEDVSEKLMQLQHEMDTLIWNKEGGLKPGLRPIQKKQIWIAESNPDEYKGQFTDALLWAKRLGTAARLGFPVVMKQLTHQSLTEPTPDFWVSLLYKTLVGRAVLDLKYFMGNRTSLQVFTHCTEVQDDSQIILDSDYLYGRGAVTVFGVNLDEGKVKLALRGFTKEEPVHVFALTAEPGDHLSGFDDDIHEKKYPSAVKTLLNGQKLSLSPTGALPVISPRVKKASRTLSVNIPARSVYFLVLPDVKIRTCMSYPGTETADEKENGIAKRVRLGNIVTDDDRTENKSDFDEYEGDSAESFVTFGKKQKKEQRTDSAKDDGEKGKMKETDEKTTNIRLPKLRLPKLEPTKDDERKLDEIVKTLRSRNVVDLRERLQKNSIRERIPKINVKPVGPLQQPKKDEKSQPTDVKAGSDQAVSNTKYITFSDDDWMSNFSEAKEAVEAARKALEALDETEKELQKLQRSSEALAQPDSTTVEPLAPSWTTTDSGERYHPSQGREPFSSRRKKYAVLKAAVLGRRQGNVPSGASDGLSRNDAFITAPDNEEMSEFNSEAHQDSLLSEKADESSSSRRFEGATASSKRRKRGVRNDKPFPGAGDDSDFVLAANPLNFRSKSKRPESGKISGVANRRPTDLSIKKLTAPNQNRFHNSEDGKPVSDDDFPSGDVYMRTSSGQSGENGDYDYVGDSVGSKNGNANKEISPAKEEADDEEYLNYQNGYRPGEFYEHEKLEKVQPDARQRNYDELGEAEFKDVKDEKKCNCQDDSQLDVVADAPIRDDNRDKMLKEKAANQLNKYYEGSSKKEALFEEMSDYDDSPNQAVEDADYKKQQKSVYASLSKFGLEVKEQDHRRGRSNGENGMKLSTVDGGRKVNYEKPPKHAESVEEDDASWETAKEILDNLPQERISCPRCNNFNGNENVKEQNLNFTPQMSRHNVYYRSKRDTMSNLASEKADSKDILDESEPTLDELREFLDELDDKERKLSSIVEKTSKEIKEMIVANSTNQQTVKENETLPLQVNTSPPTLPQEYEIHEEKVKINSSFTKSMTVKDVQNATEIQHNSFLGASPKIITDQNSTKEGSVNEYPNMPIKASTLINTGLDYVVNSNVSESIMFNKVSNKPETNTTDNFVSNTTEIVETTPLLESLKKGDSQPVIVSEVSTGATTDSGPQLVVLFNDIENKKEEKGTSEGKNKENNIVKEQMEISTNDETLMKDFADLSQSDNRTANSRSIIKESIQEELNGKQQPAIAKLNDMGVGLLKINPTVVQPITNLTKIEEESNEKQQPNISKINDAGVGVLKINPTVIVPTTNLTKIRLEKIEALRNRIAESRKKLSKFDKTKSNDIGKLSLIQRREANNESGNENKNNVDKEDIISLGYLEEGAPTCKASRSAPYIEGLEDLGEKFKDIPDNIRQRRLSPEKVESDKPTFIKTDEEKLMDYEMEIEKDFPLIKTIANLVNENSKFEYLRVGDESGKYDSKQNIENHETHSEDVNPLKEVVHNSNKIKTDQLSGTKVKNMALEGEMKLPNPGKLKHSNIETYGLDASKSQKKRHYHRFYVPFVQDEITEDGYHNSGIVLPRGVYMMPLKRGYGYESSELTDGDDSIGKYPRSGFEVKRANKKTLKNEKFGDSLESSEGAVDEPNEREAKRYTYLRRYKSVPVGLYEDLEDDGRKTKARPFEVIPVMAVAAPGIEDRLYRKVFGNRNRAKRSLAADQAADQSLQTRKSENDRFRRALEQNVITKLNDELFHYDFGSGENKLFVRSPKITGESYNRHRSNSGSYAPLQKDTIHKIKQQIKRYAREIARTGLTTKDRNYFPLTHIKTNEISKENKNHMETRAEEETSFENELFEEKHRLTLSEFKKRMNDLKNLKKNEREAVEYIDNENDDKDDRKKNTSKKAVGKEIAVHKSSKNTEANLKHSVEEGENKAEELIDHDFFFQSIKKDNSDEETKPVNATKPNGDDSVFTDIFLRPLLDFFRNVIKSLGFM